MTLASLLSRWKTDSATAPNFTAWRTLPPRPAHLAPLPPLPDPLADSLAQRGIHALYSHQAAAFDSVRRGENVVLATSTASGKTLAYNLPVIASLIENPQARALYFFPTKALTQDQLSVISDQLSVTEHWSLIIAFAVLHHIPGEELRLNLLNTVSALLPDDGRFILSNWQFLNSPRLKARIQPWDRIGLKDSDVDAGDYLLDWRRDGRGLRYVHHFSVEELSGLAGQVGLRVSESFESDGDGGKLGLYQVWRKL